MTIGARVHDFKYRLGEVRRMECLVFSFCLLLSAQCRDMA